VNTHVLRLLYILRQWIYNKRSTCVFTVLLSQEVMCWVAEWFSNFYNELFLGQLTGSVIVSLARPAERWSKTRKRGWVKTQLQHALQLNFTWPLDLCKRFVFLCNFGQTHAVWYGYLYTFNSDCCIEDLNKNTALVKLEMHYTWKHTMANFSVFTIWKPLLFSTETGFRLVRFYWVDHQA